MQPAPFHFPFRPGYAHGGLSIQRLAATLAALGVGEIQFRPPAGPPPTPLELMLYGDGWGRAAKEADRRLARPRRDR